MNSAMHSATWSSSLTPSFPVVVNNRRRTSFSVNARAATNAKTVWVWTKSKDVMTASVEGGWSTFIFTPETKDLADDWKSLAKIDPLFLDSDQFLDSENKQVAVLGQVASGAQLDSLPALMDKAEVVVMNAIDWQIIPAENMVAAFQDSNTALYATASTATDAQAYFEALEKGTDGVVLHTDDPSEVFALKAYLKEKQDSTMGVSLVEAAVTQVESVGMGDRVCVDLCNLLKPGEGLLVGSFARALFLVHSECLESNYVASRPFRVNAGPVHAYVAMAGGRTAYLSELHTGSQVLVVDAMGHSRTALVGRVKIESRPLLLVEVDVDSQKHSALLQNAETVCLVAPGDEKGAKPLPVTSLKLGDRLLLSLQEKARHTGIQIQEFVVEKLVACVFSVRTSSSPERNNGTATGVRIRGGWPLYAGIPLHEYLSFNLQRKIHSVSGAAGTAECTGMLDAPSVCQAPTEVFVDGSCAAMTSASPTFIRAYRGFYLINWVYRYLTESHYHQWVSWMAGIVQTALYADYFYYYFKRLNTCRDLE